MPPPRIDGRNGSLPEWGGVVDGAPVAVSVVGSRIEAELIVGLLRSHGLRAAVVTDDAGGQEPQWQLDGVRVLVPPSDEAAARDLLATTDDAVNSHPGVRQERTP
jgi:hypothetical protein